MLGVVLSKVASKELRCCSSRPPVLPLTDASITTDLVFIGIIEERRTDAAALTESAIDARKEEGNKPSFRGSQSRQQRCQRGVGNGATTKAKPKTEEGIEEVGRGKRRRRITLVLFASGGGRNMRRESGLTIGKRRQLNYGQSFRT